MKNINYALFTALLMAGMAVPSYGVFEFLTPKSLRKAKEEIEAQEIEVKQQEVNVEKYMADAKKRYADVYSLILQLVDSNADNNSLLINLLKEEVAYLNSALEDLSKGIIEISGKTKSGSMLARKIYKELESLKAIAFEVKDTLIPMVAFPELTFEKLTNDYKKNLAAISGGFEIEEVYPFLELKDRTAAYAMNAFQVRERIKEYKKTGKGQNEEANRYDASALRQISFMFDNQFVKNKYDAYLQGPDAFKKLQKRYADILTKIEPILSDLQIWIPFFIETECLERAEARAARRV